MKKKILVGVNQDNEFYFLEIDTASFNPPHFSMCGETVKAITVEDAKKQVEENLKDGEIWKQMVESGQTTSGLNEWVEEVLYNDELGGFDNSLYPEEITANSKDYIFASCSCGQHEEREAF